MTSDPVRCPACRGALEARAETFRCLRCGETYATVRGVPDLSLGTRFEDEADCCKWDNEESTGGYLVQSYLLPLLRRLFPGSGPEGIRVLSVGCGVGKDVEVLNANGYEAWGIDPGNRTQLWARRAHPERYLLAGAEHLPFEDAAFDFVFMNCVMPHIGVDGDSYRVVEGYDERRRAAARECARVMKQRGYLLAANPNRLCPVDLFHRPRIARHRPRLHSPAEPFLLSLDDHRRYFLDGAGLADIQALPIRGYWGFFLSSRYAIGRMLQAVVKAYFALLSTTALKVARATWINPWLVVLMRK